MLKKIINLLIVCSFGSIIYFIKYNAYDINYFHDNLNSFYESKVINTSDNDYIASIKIKKINLEKGLYSINSPFNDVNKNIQIIDKSDMPDVENGNFILAAHSGNSKVSFFRNLHKLEYDDNIEIIYKKKIYNYRVVNKYIVKKNGVVKIQNNTVINELILITCYGNNEQLIIIADLI